MRFGRIDERQLADAPVGADGLREELEPAHVVAASRDERIRDDVELRPGVLLPLVRIDFAAHRMQLVRAGRHEARQARHHAAIG
jgi:hypothetical protein